MFDPTVLLAVTATFLLAGAVKGVIGLGLPAVSLGLLTPLIGLEPGMALMLAPSLATNLWQAAAGGHGRAIAARLWPFLAAATATVWAGAALAERIDVAWLSALFGALLVVYSALGLGGVRFTWARRGGHLTGTAMGCANGVLTGLTGSFFIPSVPYLQALGLPRDMLVQAMGVLFTLSTLALGLALAGRGILGAELGLASALAILPAGLGMLIGQRLRAWLSEAAFRRALFAGLMVLGLYIVARALG